MYTLLAESITKCFVYDFNDFHDLNKEYIHTLNVSATQELHNIIMEQENKIIIQQEQINELETKYNNLQEIL